MRRRDGGRRSAPGASRREALAQVLAGCGLVLAVALAVVAR
ncbi:hypothetical protein [Streptomyces marincola]|nr:hypothetical protein [Streptomyces marincola]